MDALIVVDMQRGLLRGAPKHDLSGVIQRINRLTSRVRRSEGAVHFVQHDGLPGEDFAPFSAGWHLLESIVRDERDRIVRKTLNDSFFRTSLESDLRKVEPDRVLIAGWATDFCVDATVRSAVALGFKVAVVADGHTLSHRSHLSAQKVIEHHHWIWANLLGDCPVSILPEAEL